MRNVSNQFYNEQYADLWKPVKRVWLSRRDEVGNIWNDKINVTDTIKKVGEIRRLQDINNFNVWEKQNLMLTATNQNNEWGRDGEIFSGYRRYRSKIIIEKGYKLGDNESEEYVEVFTGIIDSIDIQTDNKEVKISVIGKSILLEEADAENVGTGSVDVGFTKTNNTKWTTPTDGVQKISEIRHSGLLLEVGIDYNISNLGIEDEPAIITFSENRVVGITGTFTKSYTGIYNIDYVLRQLLNEAGLNPSEYIVDNLVMEGEVFSNWTQGSETDFSNGTYENLTIEAGLIKMAQKPDSSYYENGYFISDTFNALSAGPFDSWVYMAIDPQFPAGDANIKIYTRTAISEAELLTADWDEIGSDGRIQSEDLEWVQFKIDIDNYNTANTPGIDTIVLYYREDDGNRKKLNFYNFLGKTVKQAIDDFLILGNYENGFLGDGTYYFRRRKSILSGMSLSEENSIIDVKDFDMGYSRIVNRIKADYGIYTMVKDGTGVPTSQEKYGLKIMPNFNSDLLTSGDGELVYKALENILALRGDPNIKARLITKNLPALELGDLCEVKYLDILDITARIVGIVDDLEEWVQEIYIEEI